MQALALLKAIEHKTHRAIADCMDARVNAPFLRPQDGSTDALRLLRGLTTGVGCVAIGFKHPGGMVGAHTIKELLKAVPLHLRTREGVFLLDLLERQGLVFEQVGVQEHAQRQVALGIKTCQHRIRVFHAHKRRIDHADRSDSQGIGAPGGFCKRRVNNLGRWVVDLVHKEGAGVVGKHARQIAVGILKDLAACGIGRLRSYSHLVDGAGIGTKGMQVNLLQKYRAVGDVLIDHRGRGHLGDIPLELDNLAAQNPLVIGMVGRKRHDTFHRHLKTGAVDEVDGKIGVGHKRALGKMRVRVDQAGHDELVAKVAHLGIGTDKRCQVSIVTAGNDFIAPHGNAALKRLEPIAGKDGVALDNYISLVHVSLLRHLWL